MQTASPIQAAPFSTTTTTAYNNQPVAANRGYFDKPADQRLRPWLFLGSLILTVSP